MYRLKSFFIIGTLYLLYVVYIAVNIDIIYWLLDAFGSDVYILIITFLFFVPLLCLAMCRRQCLTFFSILSIQLLIAWSFREALINVELLEFKSLINYYEETGLIPYKNFYILELIFFFVLCAFSILLDRLNNGIKKAISFSIMCICTTIIICSFIINRYSALLDTTHPTAYKIPHEKIFVRLKKDHDVAYVDICKDRNFKNIEFSFRAHVGVSGFSFYYLPSNTVFFNPKDSAFVNTISGSYGYQDIIEGEYINFNIRYGSKNFDVFKKSSDYGIVYKRAIPY